MSSPSHIRLVTVGQGEDASSNLVSDVPYTEFRAQALSSWGRNSSTGLSKDMKSLYLFWSHFLRHHFHGSMHEEFRRCALADLARQPPIRFGAKRLSMFYTASIASGKDIPLDASANLEQIMLLSSESRGHMANPALHQSGEPRHYQANASVDVHDEKQIVGLPTTSTTSL